MNIGVVLQGVLYFQIIGSGINAPRLYIIMYATSLLDSHGLFGEASMIGLPTPEFNNTWM